MPSIPLFGLQEDFTGVIVHALELRVRGVNVLLQVDPIAIILGARRAPEERVVAEVHHLEVAAHTVCVVDLLATQRAHEGAVAHLTALCADQLSQLVVIRGHVDLAPP